MEIIQNKYQFSKGIRFGLTLKKKSRKKEFTGEIYESHRLLKELVDFSEKNISKSISKNEYSGIPIEKIKETLEDINIFIRRWEQIYFRVDQIALDKDFYRKLSKKIGFEAFWYEDNKNGKIKKPQSREIKLSELKSADKLKNERSKYITSYWQNNLQKAKEKYREFDDYFMVFERALVANRSDNLPNEVEIRKMFLSLSNIINEVLIPLSDGSISFPNIEKMQDNSENKLLREFSVDDVFFSELMSNIENLNLYFSENGGNVPFCKATLNPKTAIKNPNSTDTSIESEVNELGLIRYFGNSRQISNTVENLMNDNIPLIQRLSVYKYKPIPSIVQFELSKFLAEKLGESEQDLRKKIRLFGKPRSPARDYAELKDKNMFVLDDYPLKTAFDFSWEGLARCAYQNDIDFPEEKCKLFLNQNFSINIDSDPSFKHYVQLAHLRDLLAKLQYGKSIDDSKFLGNAFALLNKIKSSNIFFMKDYKNHMNNIESWLTNRGKNDYHFEQAKQKIGLYRGGLKKKAGQNKEWKCLSIRNDIKNRKCTTFDALTIVNKRISMQRGKLFASMRDKITGAAELNKISYYATVLEDRNADRYILLQKISFRERPKYSITGGELVTYNVNSVTSAAISKMIRKIRLDELRRSRGNFQRSVEFSDQQKEERNLVELKEFIKSKKWDEEFNLILENKKFEQLKKEVDAKCYRLEKGHIDMTSLNHLVKEKGCLLFPIINQDLSGMNRVARNQYTKDWFQIFSSSPQGLRLTPEFRIFYRNPTPNYPKPDEKRYSRFQMFANFLVEFIPQNDTYVSMREQRSFFNNINEQKKHIEEFNFALNNPRERGGKFFVFGIDRGQIELATLCVIDQDKKIIGDFEIFSRKFNSDKKHWEHYFLEKRTILDLSNLRVETTVVVDGKDEKRKVLVDLSKIPVKDKNGNYVNPKKMQTLMRNYAYIRKLQFQMQSNPQGVIDFLERNSSKEEIFRNLVHRPNENNGLISFYGAGNLNEDLPKDQILAMLQKFKELRLNHNAQFSQTEIRELIELDPIDNFKSGLVANMVGVIAYLLEKFNYKVFISLEDLSKSFGNETFSGITDIASNYRAEGKRADVEKYAGLGLYNFFEIQLLKKLFKIQQESGNVLHLVPAFRAVKDYENIIAGKDKIKNEFGVVYFVDPENTSKTCPRCESTPDKNNSISHKEVPKKILSNGKSVFLEREKSEDVDIIRCFVCGFDTTNDYDENPYKYIKSGDDNAAYIISTLGVKAYELAKSIIK